ncbi:inner nuclear membrane protein enriched at telomere/subtelomere region [Steccherinum ochraceum]|uniref:Inner nuclear membrane protein enriched at telomere/subtelomere region n=1 Tax=Steccherinum ochraceum TaxID=92696 RepID=A0A4R0RTI8_9APHY|nr:inner nuclear membrane protein enriched at telomere/subtelomere region [Steccherinum ochraceum]
MSSKLTSAEIISQGRYLDPDFDPSTLTVAQLLGVFGFHNINYPTTYTKSKLVQLFNDDVKPHAKKFSKERLSRQNSLASDDGITDGHTGKLLSDNRPSAAPVRRSSRRVSRPASREPELVVPKAEPPKRRRSSAEPSLGGPSRRKPAKVAEPTLFEESEPEEPVVRKVSRSKKSSADAGTQARRRADDEVDSGWEDNNIFQSGAESSSPLRPSPVRPRTRRPSVMSTRSRKSMSVPPDYILSPTKGKEKAVPASRRAPSVKPPESKFEPELPAEVHRETRSTVNKSARASLVPEVLKESAPVQRAIPEEEEEEEVLSDQPEPLQPSEGEDVFSSDAGPQGLAQDSLTLSDQEANKVIEISKRISGESALVRSSPPTPTSTTPALYRFVVLLLALAASYLAYDYKQDAARIGFCETGTSSNDVLRSLQSRWAAIDSCNRENRTYLYLPNPDSTSPETPSPNASPSPASETWSFGDEERDRPEACPAPPLLPVPRPDHCTPCPAHGVCSPSTVTCETGYLIRPHPLWFFLPLSSSSGSNQVQNTYTVPAYVPPTASSSTVSEFLYKGISLVLDGLPGMDPVAFPPRCVEDPKRKARIGLLGKSLDSFLSSHRGQMGYGMEIEELREEVKKKAKLAPKLLDVFDENFDEAVQQLLQWGGVFIGEDADGKRYIAHKSVKLDLACQVKVKAQKSWKQWQNSVLGVALTMISLVFFRQRRARSAVEDQRVATLVQIALESLRNQELAHHTDPVTAPHPFLSSLQLRDLVLQDEHSVGARRRLWERVEHVVESNANVRTNLEEMEGGDEMRVWRWVGSAGKTLSPGTDTERRAILSSGAVVDEQQVEA